ncbi:MAG: winged helix-turn-helix domain-containing protein [Acidobacteria bacterium]|nr:winged helix-turn-helix domain-containing protein [Acidobacteriota bacterium]
MNSEIGMAAGQLWQVLSDQGELSLAQLKKATKLEAPLLDWAVGWLAREDKLEFIRDKRGVRLHLK